MKADTRPVANPTAITATNISLNVGEQANGSNYILIAPDGYRPFNWVTAVSSSPAIASVTNSDGSFSITGVAAGTAIITITAYNQDNTTAAATTTFTVTVSSPESGISGGVVTLNDYEDHNWSYYQSSTNLPDGYPTDYLSSPDPRNVKITYRGGGVTGASAVAISALDGEDQNEMVYYKTLEKTVLGMTGNYPYTVISNPFSKRPATGSGNNKTYYGFAGWRVVSGGEYITEYANNATLPLDATIHFTNLDNNYTPNCTSAEIVFEATWTAATVKTGNSAQSFTGGTYETNFWVLNGNNNIGNITVPANCTVSARYPDGTANFTRNLTGTITAGGNNAKVEFVNMNSTGDVTASNYTFTMGRGIVNSSNGGGLIGGSRDANCNQTVRIESGTYATLNNFTNGLDAARTCDQLMILGCDYDRAKGDNTKLIVRGNMYVGNRIQLNRTANSLYTRTFIKSGNFGSTVTVAGNNGYDGAGGSNTYYYSVANTHNAGRRYLCVEGGRLMGIAGGMDATNNQTVTARAFDLRVRGTAQVDGVVYGAAEYANARGVRTMVLTGGTVNGWVAAGANGTQTTDGALTGATYLYVGGETKVDSEGSTQVLNRAVGGNVFGAGCGFSATSSSGQILTYNTNVVVSDDAYIERGVYGGGSYGYTTNTSNIYILGGTVDGKNGGVNGTTYQASITGGVFGGACQNQGGTVNITMTDGQVNGGIYGGSNATGTISGNVTININGGQVGTTSQNANIHGGGYGAPTRVNGNVEVALGTTAQTTPGATVYGDIYGGSALGNVNIDTSNHTYVTLNKGVVYGDAYGGGLGDDTYAALVNGNVTVTENGAAFVKGTTTDDVGNEVVTAGRIFGCNNLNGSPQGTVLVRVIKTGRADGGPHTKSVYNTDGTLQTYNYEVQAVYGGGNLAPYDPTNPKANGQYTEKEHSATQKPVQVVIDGCEEVSVEYVYGGGNAAPTPSTDLVVYGAYELGMVFGGGNGRDKYTRDGGATWNVNPGADVGVSGGTVYGTGDANTTVYGGTIHELYGASNQKGRIVGDINLLVEENEAQSTCPMEIGKIVGAGKNADIDQNVNLVMGCMPTTKTDLVFAGADNANVNGHIELTITSGTFGKVFGGNNLGGIIKGYIKVNIEETGCTPIRIDELYLGGNQAAYSRWGYYESGTLPDGRTRYLPRVSADDLNQAVDTDNFPVPYDEPVLNVISCTYIGKVFGGGLGTGAAMYANPTVNINMLQGAYATQLPVDDNNPNRLGEVENVYGGGNEAAVYGNTTVNIGTTIGQQIHLTSTNENKEVLGAYITGTVYGAGKGVETDPEAAIVTGNTRVNMAGGHIRRSIYGGGELGSVGTYTEKYTEAVTEPYYHPAGAFKTCQEGTGLAEVFITGGQVGLNHQYMPDPSEPTSDDDYGYVFCASKGLADSLTYEKANLLAVVQQTHLKIDGGLIIASVYGGSENGEVLGDTYVEINDGQIGAGHYKEGDQHYWDGIYEETAWTTAIDKIKAGTFTDADAAGFHECDAWPFNPEGSRYVYDYFADDYDSKGGSRSAGNGHSFFGNVFGGGSGYYPFAPGQWRRTAGRVCGNTLVEIKGGHILTNVYGGNEITDVLGHSKVEMSGGTVGVPRTLAGIQARPVNSYVFGAGMGDPRTMFNGWSNVASAEVIVRDQAVVFGSVFGGGEDGHILGDVTTTIQDDVVIGTFGSSGVDGNVYGSGRGFSGIALTAGVVCGNVTVNIQDRVKILGSVFGGGRMAAVGTYLAPEDAANYGAMQPGDAHGNVTVNITGGTIGNLSQMATSEFSIGDVFGGSKGTLIYDWARSQKLGLVKNTTVNISEDNGSSTTIYGNVYGGGEIASVGYYQYATAADAASYNNTHALEQMEEGDVYALLDENAGTATINITAGTIGRNLTTDLKGNVFGGCLGRSGLEYSGYSFVNKSFVTLNGGTVYGCVFGGGENGHMFNDTKVDIVSGSVGIRLDNIADADLVDNLIYHGNVYGGGRGVDKTAGGNYSITAGKVNGNTEVNITGGTVYRNVYGGGSLASVGDPNDADDGATGLATVNITGGQIGTDGGASANNYTTNIPERENRRENGFVFGSGRGMAAGNTNPELVEMAYANNTHVTIGGEANVTGSVFGGGENGHVRKNTKVYIKENSLVGTELIEAEHEIDDNGRGRLLYRGNVYGGGRGIDHMMDTSSQYSLTAGRVEGNTFVEVSGGKIYHDVFGGGSLATVGTATVDSNTGEVTYEGETGNSEVHIKGGIIGYSVNTDQQGFNCGFVYGGCRGLAVAPSDDAVKMAYVHNANVYIEPGADIKGSVFGGGANGHVKADTYVEISGGSIGTALMADEVGFDDNGVAVKPVFRGNVYAGGRGVDLYQQEGSDSYSLTAGAVYGNADLKMTGGHVWHNIYGSGAMASVGTVKAKPDGIHVHDEIVDDGGNIVNPDGSDVNYLTGMFTDNTGTVTVTITGGIVGDTTPGHEGRNNGRVYGAGRGVSANRSDLVASMEYVNDTEVNIGTDGQTSFTAGEDAPYIYGAVFGGGENGHVKTDTHVNIYSGIIGWPLDEGESQRYKTAADGSAKNPFLGHVFGGGRGVDPLYHESTETRSSTAGRVYGHTFVTMTGGVVRRAIYGGGLLASVGIYRLAASDLHIIDEIEDDDLNAGKATITISGGYIGNVDASGSALSGSSSAGYAFLAPGDNNGHVFGSSCGMVADNFTEGGVAIDQQYRQMGYAHSSEVNISGGHLFGSVFGSGENGHVWSDARLNISGGEIGSATSTLIYDGNVYGSGRGVDHPHGTISETAGKVQGNTTVNITGGIVWRDVYGGGSLASVGQESEEGNDSYKAVTDDPLTTNPFPYKSGLTRVYINGTTETTPDIHGSVYGSGRGVASTVTTYRQAAYVKNTLVTIGKAHIWQNVFGGGNAGHVRRNTVVDVLDQATVDGNVYGGGAGSLASPTAGLVNHDVEVNVKGGLIRGDVYGGGAIANTNTHDKRNDPALYPDKASTYGNPTENSICKTAVNLTGGIILGDAYGGGQGVIPGDGATAAEIANAGAMVRGDVTVTLNGTAFYPTTRTDDKGNNIAASGRVFGCNNLNGTPQGTVLVHVLKTQGVTASEGTYTINPVKPNKDINQYEVQTVYGGGNLAAYDPWDANVAGQYATTTHTAANKPLQVVIEGCEETSIDYVYGGGNAASAPSTDVVVLGTYEIGTVFGGGNGKDRISYDGGSTYEDNPGADVGYLATTAYGSGVAAVDVLGGTVHSIFGGSNTKGNVRTEAYAHIDENGGQCGLTLEEVYGGGNEAYMEGNVGLDLGCISYVGTLYGGANAADVDGDILLNVTSGRYKRVFGGNNKSGTINGTITVNIEETGCNPIVIGELYGCGNQAAYTTPEGKADPVVNIKSFTSIGNVFGGGLGESAKVTGNTNVNVNEVVGLNSNGKPADTEYYDTDGTFKGWTLEFHEDAEHPEEVTSTVVVPAHETGKMGAIGTIYGGGNAAAVQGNTNVKIGTEETVVFETPATATLEDRTKTVEGADVRGNVFGAGLGSTATVEGDTNVVVGRAE